jgi:hypothetical protein
MRATPLSIAIALGILAAAPAARANSLSKSCQGFGDWTICVIATAPATSGMSCRSDTRHTVCTGPRGLRCEWVAGERPACSGGAGLQVEIRPSAGAADPSRRFDSANHDEEEDDDD